MAKIKVESQSTGTGIYTLKTGTASTNYSATLPDATGTLLMTDGDGSSLSGLSHTPEGTAVVSTGETGATKFLREDGDGTCSWQAAAGGETADAWVNFNGASTVAIRDSYNVSSITDISTGKYEVNFTTAMADANYSWASGVRGDAAGSGRMLVGHSTQTASKLPLHARNTSNDALDIEWLNAIVFGD
jgi:hypothetical protein